MVNRIELVIEASGAIPAGEFEIPVPHTALDALIPVQKLNSTDRRSEQRSKSEGGCTDGLSDRRK
jgi:hypothetical protein